MPQTPLEEALAAASEAQAKIRTFKNTLEPPPDPPAVIQDAIDKNQAFIDEYTE